MLLRAHPVLAHERFHPEMVLGRGVKAKCYYLKSASRANRYQVIKLI